MYAQVGDMNAYGESTVVISDSPSGDGSEIDVWTTLTSRVRETIEKRGWVIDRHVGNGNYKLRKG